MLNCEHGDYTSTSASISLVSTSVQQYARCEIYSDIRYFVAKRKTPIDIFRELKYMYEEGVTSKHNVREWVGEFKEGIVDVHNCMSSAR